VRREGVALCDRLEISNAGTVDARWRTIDSTARALQIMAVRIAWTIVALIIVGAAVSAVFRVATAPDRIRERRDIAKEVCLKAGGEWVIAEKKEVCKRA
jgi:hypothetical protein